MRTVFAALTLMTIVSTPALAGDQLAWIRFDKATQTYAGMKYFWLGDGDIALTIDVKPAPGRVLELLWGSKNDSRSGIMNVAGKNVSIRGGGYEGFRWIAAALPDKITGDNYSIVLKQGGGKAGFIAAVRLVDKAEAGSKAPAKKGAGRIVCKSVPKPRATGAPRGPVFPEMQKLWSAETPAPTKPHPDKAIEAAFRRAERNGRQSNEQFFRCSKFVEGWLATADKKTGLISRNLGRNRDIWNAKDSAADNYR